MKRYKRVQKLNTKLLGETGELGKIATEILGYEVVADLCNGDEIEFRRVMPDGRPDTNDCIRIEDIIK